ncbi:MAG TPA: hypothetical protein VFV33_04150 [Gemmatimonadaceae bacterium]|nr:hypothetical protein [Gemmatimonadaceae bacterium]
MAIERTYTDQEVALILRRAMERQEDGAERREGLALRDVREIAREIGVDPALVTEVAEQLPLTGGASETRWLGEPRHYEIRLMHDAALTPGQLQDLMMQVRSLAQQQGQLREVLGALEWTAVGSVDQLAVTARTSGDRTTVQIVADRSGAATLSAIGFIAAGLFGAAVTGSVIEPGVLGGVALMMGGAASGGFLGWATWRRGSRRFREKLARLADGIRQALDG